MNHSPQGCTPETQPWRVVTGLTHLYLKGPEFTVTFKRYMNDEDDAEALSNIGKVAASLNSHQALVEALQGLLDGPGDGFGHPSESEINTARAALALATGGNA